MFPWLFFSESLLAILPDTPEQLPTVLLTSFRNKEDACSSSTWGPDNVFACARHLGQVQSNTSILCVRAFHQVQCKGVLKSLCFCPGVVQYQKAALHSFRKIRRIPTMFSAMGDCCQPLNPLQGTCSLPSSSLASQVCQVDWIEISFPQDIQIQSRNMTTWTIQSGTSKSHKWITSKVYHFLHKGDSRKHRPALQNPSIT